jgi:hypothetical protein
MFFIRQGATHKVPIGPAVAVGDGFTPVTTLALSTADEAEVILHDNGTIVDISGYTWAAITTADGYYHLTLQSGISGTVGHMVVVINDDSLILPLRADFTVIEEAAYDAMYAASASPATAAALATAQTDLDAIEAAVITNAAGVDIAADIIALKAETAAILDDTDLIDDGTSGLAKIATDVAAVLVDTAVIGVAGAGLTDLGGMSTGMKAEVESEVNDAIDTAIAELGVAVPTATPTIRTALMLLYMALRNKTVVQTSGTDALEIYNDAGTKITQKLLTDDGADYTEAEMS